MEELNNLMSLIDSEKENISSNSYLQICNNLQKLQKKCFIEYDQIKNIDDNAKYIYIKQLENITLSNYEKTYIVKDFCDKYNLKYNNESVKFFIQKMKKDLISFGPLVYKVFKDEFVDFYNEKKELLLTIKEELLVQRIALFN